MSLLFTFLWGAWLCAVAGWEPVPFAVRESVSTPVPLPQALCQIFISPPPRPYSLPYSVLPSLSF